MRIIINQPRASYFVGGAEIISFEHAIKFLDLKNDVYFITLSPQSVGLKPSEQFEIFCESYGNRINIVEIKQNKKAKYIYSIQPGEDRCRWNIESIFYNQELYEFINAQKIKYDIVFSYYNLDAVFLPKNKVLKNVLYLCGIPREQNDFQGSFLSVYDNIIAISEKVKESWKKYSTKEIEVISTGVDYDKFSLKSFNYKKSEYTILYVGRLISRKNVDKIILAVEILRKKYSIKLIIVGDGPDRNNLESLSNENIFTGVVYNTETYYKKSDIFVSPSEYGEGLQGTILEAMSCGLTIVATNTDINRELLKEGGGFLVEPTVDSIVEGIAKSINADRIEISKKNRKYVIDNYSWESKVSEIQEVLK